MDNEKEMLKRWLEDQLEALGVRTEEEYGQPPRLDLYRVNSPLKLYDPGFARLRNLIWPGIK